MSEGRRYAVHSGASAAAERPFWTYAASFGALWGAVEATLGSFLHALKIPLSGVLLASIGAALLCALRTLCPRPGILLATGAICAGVKLSAPGTVLLGPAVGIMTESLLAELVMLPLGANRVSAVLAGALAAGWAVCQKVLTQIVLFGAPMLSLYKELLQRGSKLLGIAPEAGLRLVLGFVVLLVTIGSLFSLAGLRAGRRAQQGLLRSPERVEVAPGAEPALRSSTPARALPLLTVAGLAGAELVAVVVLPLPMQLAGLALVVLTTWFAARPLLSRIGSPRSWLLALVVLAGLGAVLGPRGDEWLSWIGVSQALSMVARAIALVILCQALLTLLPPPKPGSSAFASALHAALRALPTLTRTLGAAHRDRRARGVRSPFALLLGVLDDAVALAAQRLP